MSCQQPLLHWLILPSASAKICLFSHLLITQKSQSYAAGQLHQPRACTKPKTIKEDNDKWKTGRWKSTLHLYWPASWAVLFSLQLRCFLNIEPKIDISYWTWTMQCVDNTVVISRWILPRSGNRGWTAYGNDSPRGTECVLKIQG